MISLPRNSRFQCFILVLITAFLVVEFAVVKHAIDHSFQDPDEFCVVCEKADHFQKTLIGAIGLPELSITTGFEPDFRFESALFLFQSLFHSRAPPIYSRV